MMVTPGSTMAVTTHAKKKPTGPVMKPLYSRHPFASEHVLLVTTMVSKNELMVT